PCAPVTDSLAPALLSPALRDALPICGGFGMVLGRAVLIDMTDGPELFRIMNIMQGVGGIAPIVAPLLGGLILQGRHDRGDHAHADRKSTRLNSSHVSISYAVFCLIKK